MNPEVEALKNRGNEHFQKAKFLDAIDCYTAAIIIEPNHVISLGNRSACYLALSRYDEADADARRALILDKTYLKGYFRLASSLKARKLYIEAAGVASLGLDIDPDNAPLRKIKVACTKESAAQTNANSKKIFGNLYNDKKPSSSSSNISHGGQSFKSKSSSSKHKNSGNTSTSVSIANLTEIEQKMHHSIKTLVARLQNGEFSSNEADLHMLQGTFRKLADIDTFADLVFPGVPADVLNGLPKSLNELMQWKSMNMMVNEAIPKIAQAAGKIFEGVKSRGEARGDRMDAATQVVLVPQIAQESFAREVVEIVRNLSKRVSSMNARLNLTLASPTNEAATLDQLDGDIFGPLMGRDGVAIQDYFLDDEWSSLVLDDVIRYAKTEKMTETSFLPEQVSTSVRVEELDEPSPTTTATAGAVGSDKARIAWLEAKDIQSLYPALAEAIHNLHSLPFELNAKSNSAMSLLEPGHGLTMLAHIPVGRTQPPRFDNHVGENDSGLRLSCAYHLVPAAASGGAAVAGCQGTSAAQYVLTTTHDEVKADVIHDRLVLYKSLQVKNMRTVATQEYFVLYFYILGKSS